MSDEPRRRRPAPGRPRRDDGGDLARTAGFSAAKGAGLVALAVVLGIILLQIADDGSTGPVSDDGSTAATTTTTASGGGDATTTTAGQPERPAGEVRVLVLNGGAPSGAAGDMSDALAEVGYVNRLPASDDDQERTGNAVMCREGFEQEAQTLATAVDVSGGTAEVVDFRDPAPPGSADADCVVIVGAPSG